MPCLVQILTPNGLINADYQADSLADAARHEPADGVYTLANTFQRTQTLKLDAHLTRLEDSAQRVGILLQLDRPHLRAALRQMILSAGFGDVRYRITVPRQTPQQLILSIEPFKRPAPEVYAAGVRCATVAEAARQNPTAKTTGWMHERREHSLPEGVYEGLLVDSEGHILEGMSSNFYAIIDGVLRTAGEGVLGGIAQQIVFEVAPAVLPLDKRAITVSDLARVSEAFITSSSRGIVPVVAVNDVPIGAGIPGAITAQLRHVYAAWVDAHLEEL